MEIETTLKHAGKSYTVILGEIERTNLGYEEHGIFTAWVQVKGDSWGQGFGGYVLDTSKHNGGSIREGSAYGLDFIIRILETVGVKQWESLIGSDVYLIQNPNDSWGPVLGIAGKTTNKLFIFNDHLTEWNLTHPGTLGLK